MVIHATLHTSDTKLNASLNVCVRDDGPSQAVTLGHALIIDSEGRLSVDVSHQAEAGNTLPITSAAVHTQLGNIEVLLNTI